MGCSVCWCCYFLRFSLPLYGTLVLLFLFPPVSELLNFYTVSGFYNSLDWLLEFSLLFSRRWCYRFSLCFFFPYSQTLACFLSTLSVYWGLLSLAYSEVLTRSQLQGGGGGRVVSATTMVMVVVIWNLCRPVREIPGYGTPRVLWVDFLLSPVKSF